MKKLNFAQKFELECIKLADPDDIIRDMAPAIKDHPIFSIVAFFSLVPLYILGYVWTEFINCIMALIECAKQDDHCFDD